MNLHFARGGLLHSAKFARLLFIYQTEKKCFFMWNVVTWPLPRESRLIYLHWRATSLPLKSWFHPKPNCTVVAAGVFAFVFAPLAPLIWIKTNTWTKRETSLLVQMKTGSQKKFESYPLAFFRNGHGWFLEFFGTRPLPLRQFAPFLQVSRLFTPWSLIHLNSAF